MARRRRRHRKQSTRSVGRKGHGKTQIAPARQPRKRTPIEGEEPESGVFSTSKPAKPVQSAAGWTEAVNAASEATPATELGLPEAVFTDAGSHWDDVIFKPFWDSQTFSITAHICLARRIYQGSVYYGRDTLMGFDDHGIHRSLDRTVAIAAQRGFLQLFSEESTL